MSSTTWSPIMTRIAVIVIIMEWKRHTKRVDNLCSTPKPFTLHSHATIPSCPVEGARVMTHQCHVADTSPSHSWLGDTLQPLKEFRLPGDWELLL